MYRSVRRMRALDAPRMPASPAVRSRVCARRRRRVGETYTRARVPGAALRPRGRCCSAADVDPRAAHHMRPAAGAAVAEAPAAIVIAVRVDVAIGVARAVVRRVETHPIRARPALALGAHAAERA